MLRDESAAFALEFINENGLSCLCSLAKSDAPNAFEIELLQVLRCLINMPETLVKVVEHELCIKVLVKRLRSGAYSLRVREIALRSLAQLATEKTHYGSIACSKSMFCFIVIFFCFSWSFWACICSIRCDEWRVGGAADCAQSMDLSNRRPIQH